MRSKCPRQRTQRSRPETAPVSCTSLPPGTQPAQAGDLSTCYFLILLTLFTQILVLEGLSPRQAWTRSRQLNAGAGWRLVGLLIVLTLAGMMVLEVGLSKAGPWAEVLGSGLTNLLCVVGVTGVYWEGRGREEGIRTKEEEDEGEIVLDGG